MHVGVISKTKYNYNKKGNEVQDCFKTAQHLLLRSVRTKSTGADLPSIYTG